MKKLLLILLMVFLGCSIGAEPILIQLEWTAVGDDSTSGQASVYDLRYMETADSTFNWDDAVIVPSNLLPTPSVAGVKDSVILDLNFKSETTYCFAIKTGDERPNWSGISNIACGFTPDNTAPGITTLVLKRIE